ncbi:uncharacterized protein SCHCODRAFT_02641780 [Schizophyllum commune H4-8]|nr:uncharacterized protein SCHCODRAFT_02641780 [Schizophyllum commune H4-8]KAI5886450.1 hypothetical protein SCHCODRAFT_02641780 [Schizophyllum commune H4-8]
MAVQLLFSLAVFTLSMIANVTFALLQKDQIINLITFGDSYTDVDLVWDGGLPWPKYAVQYVDASRVGDDGKSTTSLDLYPFAKSGAVCSTELTPSIYDSLYEKQLPALYASEKNGTIPSTVTPDNSLYTLWIGTNDVGAWGLLTGHEIGNATVVDTVQCAVNWVKTLYDRGARNFLWQNMIPLEFAPMYLPDAYPNKFTTEIKNATAWHLGMKELTSAGNEIAKLLLEKFVPSLEGAHVGLFDSHALFSDIHAHPEAYLNGTAALNVVDPTYSCIYTELQDVTETVPCTTVEGTDRDSYMWWDELHPSEQTNRVLAKQIAQVILGEENKWTTWLS